MTSLFPPRESLVVTSRLGTGNLQTFFLRCIISTINCIRRTNCWHMGDKSCFLRSVLYTRRQFSACLDKITFHSNIFIQMYTIKNITFGGENCREESLTECTATKIPLMYSFSGNSAASAPISTFMCLHVSDLYSPRTGLHISSSRIGRPIMGIYISLTDA